MSWILPCDVLCVGLANGGRNISRSLKLLCLKRNIGNPSAIQEVREYRFLFTLQPFPSKVCPSRLSHFKGAVHFWGEPLRWPKLLGHSFAVIHLFPRNVQCVGERPDGRLARWQGLLPGVSKFLANFHGKKHSISNRLTVSKGFDRRLSPAEEQVLPPSLYILLAANILREYSVHLAKRYSACFLSAGS